MMHLMGEGWWRAKKERVQDEKDKADALWKAKEAKKLAKQKRKETRHIRKKMGLLRYYCCPCIRYLYDDTKEKLTEEERKERERLIALAKRKAELEAKNPNTIAFRKFEKKIKEDKNLIPPTIYTTERRREDRAISRGERRAARKRDPTLSALDL